MPLRELTDQERWLCNRQGSIFADARWERFHSEDFVEKWMMSESAAGFDKENNWTHGMGTTYLCHYAEETSAPIKRDTEFLPDEVMYWIGFIYRQLCFQANLTSKEAYAMFDVEDMKKFYVGFHVMSADLAVEDMLTVHEQRKQKAKKSSAPAMA